MMNTQEQQVKRFVAPTMTRALEMVRDDMGPEAVILSSQKVKGGVEVLISSEPDLPTRGVPERRAFGQNFDTDLDRALDSDMSWQTQAGIERAATEYAGEIAPTSSQSSKPDADLSEVIERAREKMFEAKRHALAGDSLVGDSSAGDRFNDNNLQKTTKDSAKETAQTRADQIEQPQVRSSGEQHHQHSKAMNRANVSPIRENEDERKLESLRGELADLRMLLEEQVWSRAPQTIQAQVPSPATKKYQGALYTHLARLGLSPALTNELCKHKEDQMLRLSEAWQKSLSLLSKKIGIATNMDTDKGGVFAFIGPTGVGKTTTLAKLAARYAVANGPGKVALVSMDTHRVGAIEQLRALGRILDAPVRAVGPGSSLVTTLASLKDFPLVLVDTAGFRYGDAKLQPQLQELDQNESVKRMLVLSSLSQMQTLKASIHAYQPRPGIDACVITKLDEAASLGEAISTLIEHDLPAAYVTDGQEIPQHIRAARAHDIVASAVSIAKRSTAHIAALS